MQTRRIEAIEQNEEFYGELPMIEVEKRIRKIGKISEELRANNEKLQYELRSFKRRILELKTKKR